VVFGPRGPASSKTDQCSVSARQAEAAPEGCLFRRGIPPAKRVSRRSRGSPGSRCPSIQLIQACTDDGNRIFAYAIPVRVRAVGGQAVMIDGRVARIGAVAVVFVTGVRLPHVLLRIGDITRDGNSNRYHGLVPWSFMFLATGATSRKLQDATASCRGVSRSLAAAGSVTIHGASQLFSDAELFYGRTLGGGRFLTSNRKKAN
jgi:hypothetical protein